MSQGGFKDLEIKSVKFSENIKEIDAQAFYNNSIENLNLPDSIKEIKWGAFQKNKISELKLSENYTDIYPSTFGDNQIKEITFGNGVRLTAIIFGVPMSCLIILLGDQKFLFLGILCLIFVIWQVVASLVAAMSGMSPWDAPQPSGEQRS